MADSTGSLAIGSCSWNYDSWLGLVYPHACRTASEYLALYAGRFRAVEIDSWFYKIPSEKEIREYGSAVDSDFRFTCKAPQELTLTFLRGKTRTRNPRFLSKDLFTSFYERIEPLADRMDAIILEFEYLNRMKMGGVDEFMERVGELVAGIPRGIPVAIECRNGNYLGSAYFSFLRENGLVHVFSEKQYMPPIASVYEEFRDNLAGKSILRLLGGDRGEIEAKTGERWDRIVDEKPEKPAIVRMVKNLLVQGKRVVVSVNNHFEGSAPLTIDSILRMLES